MVFAKRTGVLPLVGNEVIVKRVVFWKFQVRLMAMRAFQVLMQMQECLIHKLINLFTQ